MKSAKEIFKEIEEQARNYMWCHTWENVEEILVNWEKDIREDQRKKCADDWWLWFKGKKKGQPMEIILSAGKVEKT